MSSLVGRASASNGLLGATAKSRSSHILAATFLSFALLQRCLSRHSRFFCLVLFIFQLHQTSCLFCFLGFILRPMILLGIHGGGQPLPQLDLLVYEILIGIWNVAQSRVCQFAYNEVFSGLCSYLVIMCLKFLKVLLDLLLKCGFSD